MTIMNRTAVVLAASVLLFGLVAQEGPAQTLLSRSVISGGAMEASGGGIVLRGTVGQSAVGTAKAAEHAGFFGFWYREGSQTVGVTHPPLASAKTLEIRDIHPNPTHGDVTVTLTSSSAGTIEIHVVDVLGRVAMEREITLSAPGEHCLVLPLRDLTPGWYLIGTGGIRAVARRTLIIE